jgi:hypothetical protein
VEWNEFVQRLARELTHLPDSAFLVVQLPGGFPYVQAMRNSEGLSAEVVSNEFLPVPLRLGPDQEDRLTEIGWRPPGQDGHLNWWRQVSLPAEFDDFTPEEAIACGRLAGAMATALNEVFRVRSPSDLEYHANQNGPENGPIDLPYFGLRPAETASASWPDRVAGRDSAVSPISPVSPVTAPAAAAPSAATSPAGRPAAARASVRTSSVAWASGAPPGAPLPPSTPEHPGRLRPAPAQSPPAGTPVPSAAELEALLAAAKERGDQLSYFELLLIAELVMPSTGDPKAERFATAAFDDGTYVLAFTSRDAMEESLRGQAGYHRRTTFVELARNWPRPDWRLAINAGLPTAAYIDSDTITRLADEERAAETTAVEPDLGPPPEPRPAPEPAPDLQPVPGPGPAPQAEPSPRKTGPTIMQKVVPHQHVSHYLENAYDQVAGYVHRVQDVLRLDTPQRLVRGLGLTYQGSPFSERDEAIHVIRWPVVKGSLYRAPYGGQDEAAMRKAPDGWVVENPPFLGTGYAPGDIEAVPEFRIDSQRLPHGAEMYRVDRAGTQTFVAFFDADHRRWTKVQET